MRIRRILLVATVGVGGAIALGSAAWACVSALPTAGIMADPNRALVNSQVTVSGHDFASGVVNLHWAATDGVTLGRPIQVPTDGKFSTTVTIPADAVIGMNQIVAVRTGTPVVAPFEVLSPAADPVVTPPPTYITTAATDVGTILDQPADPAAPPAKPALRTLPRDEPAQLSNRAASNLNGPDGGSGAPGPNGGSSSGPGGGANVGNSSGGPGGGNTTAAADRSVQTIGSPVEASVIADNSPERTPSARSFARDLWSGFTNGPGSLVPSVLSAPQGGHTPGLALGIALALGACVALSTGFGLAEARRRRVLA